VVVHKLCVKMVFGRKSESKNALFQLSMFYFVLGSARTGLIFTGLQEGAQPGFRWGGAGWRELTRGWGAHGGGRRERLSGLCDLCCVFSFSVSLLFLFPLFAVLLNCPYPDPPVSACFSPFSSAPWRGEGQLHGALVAGGSQTITYFNHYWLKQRLFFASDIVQDSAINSRN